MLRKPGAAKRTQSAGKTHEEDRLLTFLTVRRSHRYETCRPGPPDPRTRGTQLRSVAERSLELQVPATTIQKSQMDRAQGVT